LKFIFFHDGGRAKALVQVVFWPESGLA
jgi:hypothetical protein